MRSAPLALQTLYTACIALASVALNAESGSWSSVQTRHRASIRRARDDERSGSRSLCERCSGYDAQPNAPVMPTSMMMEQVHRSSPPPGAAVASVDGGAVGMGAGGKRTLAQANPHVHDDGLAHKRPVPHSM